ncbi:MBL fold metallo-hydrolase [Candidatus Woesearchaeota archaeon]|jgi:phosphoribosyl 1,2-cyclic phosphodiesterase|nr:MBL fold metallo-hydrolase [Candidatus Woesearchaeota archaeon]MBT3537798.1 MBL fold metallo-hydrolase [Candidatus Woesearchaeota archaeon]MBT4697929.1 MBL fold metallo-hydrolase [Candidatus Woesearchaeota archaeon]MBT4717298.1 MBL fold metallo-hydrolase [Candidatus Woesearchaeota archaeon]MBT7105467.1 MBL fold metallo-hydrolase [Candidatus Woesearchaeota archaeon]
MSDAEIYFLGVRGSIPAPSCNRLDGSEFHTLRYGGNTTCLYVKTPKGRHHILDAGSGIRELGLYLGEHESFKMPGDGSDVEGKEANLFISHTHWDHIQGFPFFKPAYAKGNQINVYGQAQITGDLVKAVTSQTEHPEVLANIAGCLEVNGAGIREVLARQQESRTFPAPLQIMGGLGKFTDFIPGGRIYNDDEMIVGSHLMNHPGGCVSYKFKKTDGGMFVFATDFEPDFTDHDEKVIAFWTGANVVYADGQYEDDSKVIPFMKTWGHSTYQRNIIMAAEAGIDLLILGHHDPLADDSYLMAMEDRAKAYARRTKAGLDVIVAKEGTHIGF